MLPPTPPPPALPTAVPPTLNTWVRQRVFLPTSGAHPIIRDYFAATAGFSFDVTTFAGGSTTNYFLAFGCRASAGGGELDRSTHRRPARVLAACADMFVWVELVQIAAAALPLGPTLGIASHSSAAVAAVLDASTTLPSNRRPSTSTSGCRALRLGTSGTAPPPVAIDIVSCGGRTTTTTTPAPATVATTAASTTQTGLVL